MASFAASSSRVTARPASSRRVALPRRARAAACSAAAAPGGGQTPREALGLSNDADFDTVKRVYNMSKRAAERAGDSAKVKVIQEAYDTIMMGGLSSRVANYGKKEDPPEVLYADKTPLFPWRPRVEVETTNNIVTNTGIFGILAAWALTSAVADFNPLVFGTVASLFRLMQKLSAFSPSPKDQEKKKIADRMRLFRVLALTFGCVAITCVAVVALPDFWAKATGSAIPIFTLQYREPLINGISLALMWSTVNFLR